MTPLDRLEARSIVRYWLAGVRESEALAARPQARRPLRGVGRVNEAKPRSGQDYFKLLATPDVAEFLLHEKPSLKRDLDAERAAFCEHWLALRQRMVSDARWGRADDREPAWLVGFPVLFAKRREELVTLLRFRVDVSFEDTEGKRYGGPARRKRDAPKNAPAKVKLAREGDIDARMLAYSIDGGLLNGALGLPSEDVDDFYAALRGQPGTSARFLIGALCDFLENDRFVALPEEAAEGTPSELFERLAAAVAARHGDAYQMYPIGLCYDGTKLAATWYLQRDLNQALKRGADEVPWRSGHPASRYLTGEVRPSGESVLLGVHRLGVTDGQREAAERFLGSPLSAVQGPPGTGKTTLIQTLAAHTLVERIRDYIDRKRMPTYGLVVASTNNRAVDNALEPMLAGGLPVAVRVGSRAVTATVAAEVLGRARAWLDEQPEGDRLAEATAVFETALDALRAKIGPREEATKLALRRERLVKELAELAEVDTEYGPAAVAEARKTVRKLRQKLNTLARSADRGGDLESLNTAWRRIERQHLPPVTRSLGELSLTLTLGLPPKLTEGDVEDHQYAWMDALEDALADVDLAAEDVEGVAAARETMRQRADLSAQLAVIPETFEVGPDDADAERFACFQAALAVREQWAVKHRDGLGEALGRAVEALPDLSSFKRLFDDDSDAADWIKRLFPVVGCTLLSMGNTWPADPNSIDRLVIDEAGQCHPAYALSGLLRATSTLLIGDVNQLEPVIGLTRGDEARVRKGVGVDLDDDRFAPYVTADDVPTSAQRLADRAVDVRPTLRDHFRCQAPIIALSDALCDYGLRVRTPERPAIEGLGPVSLVPVHGEQIRSRGSWRNDVEVQTVLGVLQRLGMSVRWDEVALLTPYVGQLEALRRACINAGLPVGDGGLAVGTVHRFQGGERRLVVFSTVVSSTRSLTFLNRRVNLVNVAVSRARDHLITVGHPEVLEQGRFTKLLVHRSTRLGHR